MTNRLEDIRKLMTLLESSSPDSITQLEEGIFQSLRNSLNRRLGRKEREEVTRRLVDQWYFWLGKADREGNLSDMEVFLQKVVGLTVQDVETILNLGSEPAIPVNDPPKGDEDDGDESADDGDDQPSGPNEPEDDSEDGRPIPDDLNTKRSDYGEVGDEQEVADINADEVVDDNGKIDYEKIQAHLDDLGPGAMLRVAGYGYYRKASGNTNKAVKVRDDDRMATAESILTELTGGKLTKKKVFDLLGRAVVHYNNTRHRDDVTATKHAGSTYDANGNKKQKAPSGRGDGGYNLDAMWEILKANHIAPGSVTRLMNKVLKVGKMEDLSDMDRDTLSVIGYAFLRSRG